MQQKLKEKIKYNIVRKKKKRNRKWHSWILFFFFFAYQSRKPANPTFFLCVCVCWVFVGGEVAGRPANNKFPKKSFIFHGFFSKNKLFFFSRSH